MSIHVPSFASFPDFDRENSREPEPSSSKPIRDSESKKERRRDERRRRSHSRSPSRREKGGDRDKDRHWKREKEKHKSRDRDEEKRRRREEKKSRHEERAANEVIGSPAPIEDTSYRLFFSDRKPDKLNVVYGGLHQGDVPKYRMVAGGRRVLGLPPAFVVVRRVGNGIEIGLSGSKKMSGISDSRTKSLLALPPTRHLARVEQPDRYPEIDGVIRLPSRRAKSAPEDTYRSITRHEEGESSASDIEDYDSHEEDEDSQDEGISETSYQTHLRNLESRLATQPDSIATWLALLDHTLSTVPTTSKNATRARCDIAVSLLSRAFSAHPANASSTILRIKYLKAGEEIWQVGQLAEEWEKALKLGGIEIWMEWLEWRSRQGKLEFTTLIDDAGRALAAFGEHDEDQFAKLRIFWRIVVATRNAGYTERAFAMLQAQCELTFNLPDPLIGSSFEQQLDELEEFWESETPRIGEEQASGWRLWYDSGKPEWQQTHESASAPPEPLDLDPYRQWAAQESAADKMQMLPSRASMGSDDLDPYSTILFSDIRPVLIKLESRPSKVALRLIFLSFLGLHIPGFSLSLSHDQNINWDDRWSLGVLCAPTYLEAIFPGESSSRAVLAESVSGVIVGREKEYRDAFGPVKQWAFGVFHPLDVYVTTKRVTRQRLWNSTDVSAVDIRQVRRIFSQLRKTDDDHMWDSWALAFEAALNVKNALKLSKAFLSVPKATLEYWSAHAQLERIHGKLDGARKVYQTLLVASKTPRTQPGCSQMWWNWAEMEWLSGSNDQALNVILQSAGVSKVSDVGLLRARQSLREAVDSTSDLVDKETWLKMFALLELLRGAEIETVLSIFDGQVETTANGCARERLTLTALLFVYHHRVVLNNSGPPALLRERAASALQQYPSNSVVLGIFLEAEKGQGIWGRVRNVVGGGDNMAKDVSKVLQEVWVGGWEKGRWASEVERARSALAAAVEHERTRSSAIIWRAYLELEIRAGKLKDAKKLLFRAVSECPFVKDIYLLAFGPMRSVFDSRELQSLADLMAERGLRLRQELHGAVEPLEDHVEDNSGDEDEIFDRARELRRLMPYH
ncbi:hypothetical protein CC2G_000786 [Coprinopsis cinerea AmutBmut pab1-1]|nr:hypothetical protein CC2G_000786 [Coprinopsis cinerea AmutBmut pab1-1]